MGVIAGRVVVAGAGDGGDFLGDFAGAGGVELTGAGDGGELTRVTTDKCLYW